MIRHPRTTQERRENQEEYGRASRGPKRLAQAYDDMSPRSTRSWKKHRKHQWK
jgi:hypothetical protein